MHQISISSDVAATETRDSVGGTPFLADGDSVPACRLCGASMALFLQLDVRPEFGLPFAVGSHLLVFMCPKHNEIPSVPDNYDSSDLPAEFWLKDDGHYSLQLIKPGIPTSTAALDPFILARRLDFTNASESIQDFGDFERGSDDFKIGGVPGWINYSINKSCPCGGKMSFVCQIPDGFGFQQTETAPEQPDSFSNTEYCLLLGNQVFILACDRQCNPNALIAICDN